MPSHDRSLVGICSAFFRRLRLADGNPSGEVRPHPQQDASSSKRRALPAFETVPWNQCLVCVFGLLRTPTSLSRPSCLRPAPVPFPRRYLPRSGGRWPRGHNLPPSARSSPCGHLLEGHPSRRSRNAYLARLEPCSRPHVPLAEEALCGVPARRLSSCRLAMRYREGLATLQCFLSNAALFERSFSRRTSRKDPRRQPKLPERRRCGRARLAVASDACTPSAKLWSGVLLSAAPRCFGSTVLSTVSAVRPARSSRALRHDELGHPGLSAALETSSGSAWERYRR